MQQGSLIKSGRKCGPDVWQRYAVIKVSGDIHKVATAWDYLYRDWLINSVHEPEHAPALETFLDKENATDWSHFELELCLPVRKTGRDEEFELWEPKIWDDRNKGQ